MQNSYLKNLFFREPKNYPITSNRVTGPGTLRLELKVPSNVYVHSPEDVPYLNAYSSEYVQADSLGWLKRRQYSITEIINEREVQLKYLKNSFWIFIKKLILIFKVHDVDISQRQCRYPDENYLNIYEYYSYTACVVQCRAKEQIRLCNCTNHLTPKTSKFF